MRTLLILVVLLGFPPDNFRVQGHGDNFCVDKQTYFHEDSELDEQERERTEEPLPIPLQEVRRQVKLQKLAKLVVQLSRKKQNKNVTTSTTHRTTTTQHSHTNTSDLRMKKETTKNQTLHNDTWAHILTKNEDTEAVLRGKIEDDDVIRDDHLTLAQTLPELSVNTENEITSITGDEESDRPAGTDQDINHPISSDDTERRRKRHSLQDMGLTRKKEANKKRKSIYAKDEDRKAKKFLSADIESKKKKTFRVDKNRGKRSKSFSAKPKRRENLSADKNRRNIRQPSNVNAEAKRNKNEAIAKEKGERNGESLNAGKVERRSELNVDKGERRIMPLKTLSTNETILTKQEVSNSTAEINSREIYGNAMQGKRSDVGSSRKRVKRNRGALIVSKRDKREALNTDEREIREEIINAVQGQKRRRKDLNVETRLGRKIRYLLPTNKSERKKRDANVNKGEKLKKELEKAERRVEVLNSDDSKRNTREALSLDENENFRKKLTVGEDDFLSGEESKQRMSREALGSNERRKRKSVSKDISASESSEETVESDEIASIMEKHFSYY